MAQANYLHEILEKIKEDQGELLKFCLKAKLFDINAVVASLMSSKNAKHIYYFLLYIQSFGYDDLVFRKVKLVNGCYETAEYRQVEAEIIKEIASKLVDLLIEIQAAEYICSLAQCAKQNPRFYYYIDMSVLEDGILKTDSPKEIYSFALKFAPSDISKFAKRMIELKNPMYIFDFAKNVPNAPVSELMEAEILLGDPLYIGMFALIPNTPTERLEDEVISLNDPEGIYFLAYNINGASIQKLTKAIIATEDVEYIALFAQHVPGASLPLLIDALMKQNAFDKLVCLANQFPDYAASISAFILETKNPAIINTYTGFKDRSIKEKLQAEYILLLEEQKRREANAPFNRLVALSQSSDFSGVNEEFALFQGLFTDGPVDDSWKR